MATPIVFFGYPSQPANAREAVSNAAAELGAAGVIDPKTWESLRVAGHVIIDQIIQAIDSSQLCVFEVTDLNENVMFELGYAIGSDRKIWLLRDTTITASKRKWEEVGTLTAIGYQPYTNSTQVSAAFYQDQPHENTGTTIFVQSIRPGLVPMSTPSVLHIPSLYPTEASRVVTNRLRAERSRGLRYAYIDPNEPIQPLVALAQEIFAAAVVLIHFTSPERDGAAAYNARAALTAGLARGMGKPVLMLADANYLTPIDYRDLLHVYRNTRDLQEKLDEWLAPKLADAYESIERGTARSAAIKLAVDLKGLRLGEYVAEYESEALSQYFVETPAFRDVLALRTTVFVGRRGTGKTANFLQAEARLRDDAGNLVCVIKPIAYEWEAILRVLERFERRDTKTYLVQAVWKFLLLTEIARELVAELERRPQGAQYGEAGWDVIEFVRREAPMFQAEFATRLDVLLKRLQGVTPTNDLIDERRALAEAMHDELIRRLKGMLGNALSRRHRVAILVDNLDKGWQRDADLDLLSQFLLGLLTASTSVGGDLFDERRKRAVPVTLAIFLRTDIFGHVIRRAREPDKIPVSRIGWENPEVLLRIVEDRFVAVRGPNGDPNDLWRVFFTPRVSGTETRRYLTSRVLPRPRDLVYLCNAAIGEAVQKGNGAIEEADVLAAERLYSQFAYEALTVEDAGATPELEALLFEFIGKSPLCTEEAVLGRIASVGYRGDARHLIRYLREASFLGIETAEGRFSYSDEPREFQRDDTLASKLAADRGTQRRYVVHPAFRPYLGIPDAGEFAPQNQLPIFGRQA